MVFSSALFLFAFLPLTYILYQVLRGIKAKNALLLIVSLVFYASGRLDWLLLLLFSCCCNYLAGLFMTKGEKSRKIALVVAICINLGLLGVFKYLNFFTETLNHIPFLKIAPTNIALPIGISFFTFQGMSYVIDVYKRPQEATKSFTKVLLYISFFPQLVAGPIVKYSDIADQIDQRESTPEMTVLGIRRFVLGLVKKLFFANGLGQIADSVYGMDISLLDSRLAWLGVLCYTLQIYYDFSAYSDMAIGLGRMFGFRITENFTHPYCASSVKEFWRRWHISLSSWFREYLYIPLGGNRHGVARARLNRLIVFFFTGMWHGANWTFILWGLWHGLFLFLEDFFSQKKIRIPVLNHLYTLWVVAMGFMLFRADSIGQAGVMLRAMYTGFAFQQESTLLLKNLLTPQMVSTLLVGAVGVLPVLDFCRNQLRNRQIVIPSVVKMAALMVVFLLCVMKLAASSFNPFIYTQF